MSIYGDNQCAQCGAVRVAGSTLCPQCLAKWVNTSALVHNIAEARIKELEHEKKLLSELVVRLLDHISSEAVYTSELRLELWKAKGSVTG